MKQHKRLGKGLEEVSHLFLSGEKTSDSSSQDHPEPGPAIQEAPDQHYPGVVAVTGDHRSLEKSFLVSNLALELARRGRQMRVLDADPSFPDQSFFLGLRPADSVVHLATGDQDVQDLQVILQGPLGVKLLSLDIDFSRLAILPEQARRRLMAGLRAFEAGTHLMLVDTPAHLNPNSRLIFQLAHQIVVLIPSDPLGMIDAYTVIKSILTLRPGAPVEMVVYNIKMVAEAKAIAHQMAQAVTQFLNSHIADLGFLYDDLNIAKSISQRRPLVLSAFRSRAAMCVGHIAEKIWAQEENRVRINNGSFFEAIKQALEDRR